MAISRALYSGVSGLRNHSVFMDVIANNIANVNTIGYKASRVTFEETFAMLVQGASRPPGVSGGINPMQMGLGSSLGSVDVIHTQGTLESTGITTDLSIEGEGFFIVSDGVNQTYTRAGAFQFDSTGKLVSPNNGFTVQGVLADAQGNIKQGAAISDIILPFGQKSPAKATTSVSFTGNLDAGQKAKGTVLSSKAVYAREIPGKLLSGSNSNIQNMLALNTTTTQTTVLEGIAPNTTTVTVSDGNDRNADGVIDGDDAFVFTYVAINTASNYDFNSFQDLVDGINAVFGANGDATAITSGSATLSVSFESDGSLKFTRVDPLKKLLITSTNSNLQRSLESANNDDIAISDSSTNQFSHIATKVDSLTNLRNSAGTDFGLLVGDTINIAGRLGGRVITTNLSLTIAANSTVETFEEQVRKAYDITVGSVAFNSAGELVITGDGGTANEITALDIQATDAAGAAVSNFNAIYDSTPNNYVAVQAADDVTGSASATVFDSLGQKHILTLNFKKDSKIENRWTWDIQMAQPATTSGGNTGVITFATDGSLASFIFDGAATSLQFEPKTGALNPVTINVKTGTIRSFNGITQLGTDTSLVANDQDGYGLGELSAVSIDEGGRIEGQFTNGRNLLLAQVMVAAFNNESGLMRVGDNNYIQSANSGTPIIGAAGTAIKLKIVPGALEQSNVDLAQEFTNMIVAQRGFQASARIITVGDQFLTEIMNLKS